MKKYLNLFLYYDTMDVVCVVELKGEAMRPESHGFSIAS